MSDKYPLDLTRRQPNIYGFSGLDRSAHLREEEGWLERLVGDATTRLVPVWRSRSLVFGADSETPAASLLSAREFTVLIEQSETVIFLGNRNGEAHVAVDLSHLEEEAAAAAVSGTGEFMDLRQVGPVLERFEGSVLAYAPGSDALASASPLLRRLRLGHPDRERRAPAQLHERSLQHPRFPAHRSRRHHAGA